MSYSIFNSRVTTPNGQEVTNSSSIGNGGKVLSNNLDFERYNLGASTANPSMVLANIRTAGKSRQRVPEADRLKAKYDRLVNRVDDVVNIRDGKHSSVASLVAAENGRHVNMMYTEKFLMDSTQEQTVNIEARKEAAEKLQRTIQNRKQIVEMEVRIASLDAQRSALVAKETEAKKSGKGDEIKLTAEEIAEMRLERLLAKEKKELDDARDAAMNGGAGGGSKVVGFRNHMDMKALLKSRMDFYRRNPGERARLMARAESRKLEKYGRIQTEGVKRNIKQTKRWNKIKADTTKKKRESENRRRAAVLKRRSEKSKLERQASEVAFKRVAAERKKRAEARLTPQQRLLRSKSQTSLARRRAAEKKLKSEEARERAKWKARANDPTTSN